MNECGGIIIVLILFLLNEIVFFIIDILILAKSIWTTKAIFVLFCLYFTFSCVRFIHTFSLFIIACFDKCKKLFDKMITIFGLFFCLFIIFWIFELIILTINYTKFKSFWKDCPYLLSNFEYNIHFERRCELYNINHNSRYSYQYICSYDSSKDFKKYNIKKEIQNENIICIPVKGIKETNVIIYLFND